MKDALYAMSKQHKFSIFSNIFVTKFTWIPNMELLWQLTLLIFQAPID